MITLRSLFKLLFGGVNRRPSPLTHSFKRVDCGIARTVECSCGHIISGYSWKSIQDEMDLHIARFLI